MPRPTPEWLPTTAYAILGLLSFGDELTGYEIKRRSEVSLRFFFWSPAMSQVYSEIKRLTQQGFLQERVTPIDDIRSRRVYSITPSGRKELANWVNDGPPEFLVLKHLSCLRLFYGHLVEPAQLSPRMEDHATWSMEQANELREVLARLPDGPQWDYAAFVIEWGIDYYETEARSARRVVARLDARARGERLRPGDPTQAES